MVGTAVPAAIATALIENSHGVQEDLTQSTISISLRQALLAPNLVTRTDEAFVQSALAPCVSSCIKSSTKEVPRCTNLLTLERNP